MPNTNAAPGPDKNNDASHRIRPHFRVRIGLTLAALPVLALLLTLGTWQVQRHFWKQGVIAQRADQAAAPACMLTEPMDITPDCTRYSVRGTIDPATLFEFGSDRDQGIPGRFIVGLMQVANSDLTVWTRIGFVQQGKRDQAVAAIRAQDTQTYWAVFRPDGWTGAQWLKPVNDPARGLWAYLATDQLDRQYAQNALSGQYLQLTDGPALDAVKFTDYVAELPNNHWHYALTWYSLALILVVIWFLLCRQPVAQSVAEPMTSRPTKTTHSKDN